MKLLLISTLVTTLAFPASDSIPLSVGIWTFIGPAPTIDGVTGYAEATAGRVTAIAADPKDPSTLYIGSAGGGVWKTTDGGITWTALTDFMPSLFIGAVAVAPSKPQVIYAGSGEANNGPSKLRANRYNIYSGRGIFKSTDSGATWTQLGADLFYRRTFSKIAVQPDNSNIVYAAVGAVASEGLAGNTGVWKSTDGGATWTNLTKSISTTVPVSDLLIDPANSKRLYAAFGDPLGSSVNNVYQSTDAGVTWKAVNLTGMQSKYGRISLAMAGSKVLALVAEASATSNSLWGLYQSTDLGAKWSRLPLSVNDQFCPEFGGVHNVLAVAGDYHQAVAVDPNNPNNLYVAGLCIIGSNDGGNKWTLLGDGEAAGPHHDHHALSFDAGGSLLDANDGGIWRLDNADFNNLQWTNIVGNLGIAQFNSVATDPSDWNHAVGGLQDMGAAVFYDNLQWTRSIRGDGGTTIIDPTRLQRVYQELEEGAELFTRSLDGGFDFTYSRRVVPDVNTEKRMWYFPMAADPADGAHVVLGTYRLWYTADEGAIWNALPSPNAPADPITALAYAPSAKKQLYIASAGSMYVTADFTAAKPVWTKLSVPGAREISSIIVNPADQTTLCVSRNTYLTGQVLCSADSGRTWVDASGTIPAAPVYSLAIDFTQSPIAIYAGTIGGVYNSTDGGANWNVYGGGLPNTAVAGLTLQGNVLTAATHGRGAWQILTQ